MFLLHESDTLIVPRLSVLSFRPGVGGGSIGRVRHGAPGIVLWPSFCPIIRGLLGLRELCADHRVYMACNRIADWWLAMRRTTTWIWFAWYRYAWLHAQTEDFAWRIRIVVACVRVIPSAEAEICCVIRCGCGR